MVEGYGGTEACHQEEKQSQEPSPDATDDDVVVAIAMRAGISAAANDASAADGSTETVWPSAASDSTA